MYIPTNSDQHIMQCMYLCDYMMM